MEGQDRDQLLLALQQGRLSVLTMEEAATVLRIGRGTAYAAARRWRDSQGRVGLPVVSFGRSLRVPAEPLKRLLADPASIFMLDDAHRR